MKMSLFQIIAIVCFFLLASMVITPFISKVEAHAYEAWYHIHDYHCAAWYGTYHTYCGGRRVVTLRTWAPAGHPGLDDPDHENHQQTARPTVHTSSLERVDNCSACTYS